MTIDKRKMPVKTQVINLTGDYEGWTFTGRTNPRMSTLDDISSGNFKRISDGLAEVIIDWNFVDEDGNDLPNPAQLRAEGQTNGTITDVMGSLPLDLTLAVAKAISDAITGISPN